MNLFQITNQFYNFVFFVGFLAILAGIVFYLIHSIKHKNWADLNAYTILTSLFLVLILSGLSGVVEFYFKFPLNVYVLFNGLIVFLLFSDFLGSLFERDSVLKFIFLIGLYLGSLFISVSCEMVLRGEFNYFLTHYFTILSDYLFLTKTNLNLFLDLLFKLYGGLLALKGFKL